MDAVNWLTAPLHQSVAPGFAGTDLFNDTRLQERIDGIHGSLLGDTEGLPYLGRSHLSVIAKEEKELFLLWLDQEFLLAGDSQSMET